MSIQLHHKSWKEACPSEVRHKANPHKPQTQAQDPTQHQANSQETRLLSCSRDPSFRPNTNIQATRPAPMGPSTKPMPVNLGSRLTPKHQTNLLEDSNSKPMHRLDQKTYLKSLDSLYGEGLSLQEPEFRDWK